MSRPSEHSIFGLREHQCLIPSLKANIQTKHKGFLKIFAPGKLARTLGNTSVLGSRKYDNRSQNLSYYEGLEVFCGPATTSGMTGRNNKVVHWS